MDLDMQLRTFAGDQGTDYFGIADLSPARDFILKYGGERLGRYPRAVSFGIVLLGPLVDLLSEHGDRTAAMLYRHHAYDVVNARIDQVSLDLANRIQRAGYSAFPVPASKRADDGKIAAIFSHKLAAHMAGLGWIGKNCLLITPDHGPRVRWGTVLTDAPLSPAGYRVTERCGGCTACMDACPINAITGRAFDPGEEREARYDARACDQYYKEMEQAGKPTICGLCLYSCPWGRKGTGK